MSQEEYTQPEEQNSVQQEHNTVQQEAVNTEQALESTQEQEATGGNSPQESFANLRKKTEQLEKERDEMRRQYEELQRQAAQQEQNPPQYDQDDLIEGKHLKYFEKKLKQLEEANIEAQLRSQYPDFDKVVTPQNLQKLKEVDPELAESIHYNPNLQSKARAAYKAIQRNQIGGPDRYQKDRDRAQTNALKPKPSQVIAPQEGDTPLSKANAFSEGLTDDLKRQLYKEMMAARKNL